MTARLERILLLALLSLAWRPAVAAVVLTGEVRSDGAQTVLVPPSMSSPVVLRYYLPDGTKVNKGDVLLRIDAGQAASQLRTLKDQIETAEAGAAKDLAALELAAIDAELALVDAEAKRDTAAVDAALPKTLLSALDYDRYQGAFESARREVALKQSDLDAARAAVTRKRKDAALEVQKSAEQLAFNQAMVDGATVRATQAGTLVHAFQSVVYSGSAGGRYEEGSSAQPGSDVGSVLASGKHSVEAWALGPDRRGLTQGQKVRLSFDALPGRFVDGHIRHIAGAPEKKPAWGDGRYYRIDIALGDDAATLPLLPGMSVRIETDPAGPAAVVARSRKPTTLHAVGEVYPKKSVSISPPEVEGLWMMNVTQMAADGEQVSKGQPVVVFAGGSLMQELPAKQSELKEKLRSQEQLKLQLADRARSTQLATAQARADAEKAQRKADQPKDYVPGVEYKKLIIDRERSQRRLALTEQRERIDARARAAEQHAADVAVAQLQRNVAEMRTAVAKLTVPAPIAGLFIHHDSWSGGKIDVGSQVWRGQSVAEIPDLATLAVSASLPERDLERVHVGMPVTLTLTGGASSSFSGHIASIGTSVHSKSRVEPVPVVDLDIAIDAGKVKLKPGQPVRLDIAVKETDA
ncbi:MAG TPA: HlyD family efflux transporter periplasmic adaptor subunit [Rhodanobacteraceae bacterium]|nr:HlyD family efflux transporter periplasmic adaptor subunit [Rhodanobacteraceae bacterium]